MAVATNKRSVMTLFSEATDIYSHQVRIVLAEKGVGVEIENVNLNHLPEEMLELNPYATVPTLVDRDLVLYESQIIMEYLDERFPHPPLLPVYPVARAQSRLWIHRIEKDWCTLVDGILANPDAKKTEATATTTITTNTTPAAATNAATTQTSLRTHGDSDH